jgi:protein-S-isoprenylcysteine O-methyltransferase Ste14
MNMRKSKKGDFLFYVAGGLLVLAFVLGWFVSSPSALEMLHYIGWIIWAVGIVLIFLPMFVFYSKGRVEKGESFVHTKALVETGIYAVFRHPLYLGWLLMYPAIIFWGQHWLTAIIGIPGMVCIYLISKQEDQRLIEKFGAAYKRYMQSVPRMNFLVGVIRLVRRRKRGGDRI